MSLEYASASIIMSELSDFQLNLRIDYSSLSRAVLQQLRGNVSQRELSERLGYTFNQVGKWESGATQIKWDGFILLCRTLNVPLEKAFRDCFWTFHSEFNVATTLKALEDTFSTALASDNPFHAAYKKWETGRTVPDLAEILKLIGSAPTALISWLSLFLDCDKIPSLAALNKELSIVIDVFFKNPEAAFVYSALQLEAYQSLSFHDETLLAEHSACTRPQLRSALEILLSNGLVRFDGQKFHSVPKGFDISWLNHPKFRSVTKHATLHAARRFLADPKSKQRTLTNNISYASSRQTCVSSEAALQISRMILRFHNQMSEVLTNDHQSKNNVQVILSHVHLPALNARNGTDQLSSTEIDIQQENTAPTTASVFTSEPKVNIDFTCAAREILQVMRGELSQRDLSKKLGYTFNQVGKWESGATQIKWDDFLHICQALNAPLEKAFGDEFITPEPELTSLVTLKTLSNHFSAGIEQDKKTRASMKKWLSGNSAPDLAEVLKFMASRIALMLKWLSALIDCNQVPSLREANELYLARFHAAFKNPNATLIYAALSLDAYQKLDHHDEHLLTTHTSCALTQIRQIINDLHSNGFIQFDGKKYIPISHIENHTNQWEIICQMTTLATQRYSVKSPLSQQIPHMDFYFSVATSRVVPLSTQGSKTVRDLIWKYQSEVLEVIKRDRLPKHHLLNIILHSYRSNTNAPEDPDFENF